MSTLFARRTTLVCLVLFLNPPVSPVAVAAGDDAATAPPPLAARAGVTAPTRPSALVPLYVSLGSLQALDLASTLHALDRGGVEANPVMRGIVDSPPCVIALKAGFTGLVIYSGEKLWKQHRTAAILWMVGLNGAYAAIVAHNYSVR
jgi:uncharacterized protein DUF5658